MRAWLVPLVAVPLLVTLLPASAEEPLGRGLVARPTADGGVFLGWRLLRKDDDATVFHIYRRSGDSGIERRLTSKPIAATTNFLDTAVEVGGTYHYVVRPQRDERPGAASASATVRVPARRDVRPFVRIPLRGDYDAMRVAVADLDGDGAFDYVIKQPRFNTDPYQRPGYWKRSPTTYKLEAYRSDGTFLWRYDMGWAIEAGYWYAPYVVYDVDGDGRAEVYTKAGEGDPREPTGQVKSGPEYLVKIDGRSGKVQRRIRWPDRSGFESYNYYCRNMLGVAYLDGKSPSIVIVRGTYTQIKVEAYDRDMSCQWKWNSRNEKQRYNGQGMHGFHAADVDGDGRDEIVLGAAVLDEAGKGLWTLEMGHPDVCYVGDIDPARVGKEIFYGFETRQKTHGVCLVEAATGRKLWAYGGPTRHVHGQGMVADITDAHPGQEVYAGEKDKSNHWMYAASGARLGEKRLGDLNPRPVWWDDDEQKELLMQGRELKDYGGKTHLRIEGTLCAIADCLGDWREEIVTSVPGELRIYTTTIPSSRRRVTPMQDRQYRLGVSAVTSGYYYPPQLGGAPANEREW